MHPCLNPYSEDSNNSNINVIISDDEDERNVYEIDNEEGNEGNMENDFKNIIEHLVKIALSSEDALSLLIEVSLRHNYIIIYTIMHQTPTERLNAIYTFVFVPSTFIIG